jgi:uncharacterized protein (DUF2062 family)
LISVRLELEPNPTIETPRPTLDEQLSMTVMTTESNLDCTEATSFAPTEVAANRMPWWANPSQMLREVLAFNDTPKSIALGAAVGIFVGLTPTGGIQTLLVLAFSLTLGRIVRFNLLAAMVALYISNPLTAIPIYWCSYYVGTLFVHEDIQFAEVASIVQFNGFQAWWQNFMELIVGVGSTMLLGSLVVGAAGALITYPAMLWLLKMRQSRPELGGESA